MNLLYAVHGSTLMNPAEKKAALDAETTSDLHFSHPGLFASGRPH
jgi:hypothetical protein